MPELANIKQRIASAQDPISVNELQDLNTLLRDVLGLVRVQVNDFQKEIIDDLQYDLTGQYVKNAPDRDEPLPIGNELLEMREDSFDDLVSFKRDDVFQTLEDVWFNLDNQSVLIQSLQDTEEEASQEAAEMNREKSADGLYNQLYPDFYDKLRA